MITERNFPDFFSNFTCRNYDFTKALGTSVRICQFHNTCKSFNVSYIFLDNAYFGRTLQLLSSVFSGFTENSRSVYLSVCSSIRDLIGKCSVLNAFDANHWPDWIKRGWDALKMRQKQQEVTSTHDVSALNRLFQRALELIANESFNLNFIDNVLTCAAFCIVGCLFGGWIGLFFGAILGGFISHGLSYFPDCKLHSDFVIIEQFLNFSIATLEVDVLSSIFTSIMRNINQTLIFYSIYSI